MKIKHLFSGLILISTPVFATEPDLLVTQKGECLKVYNLDINPSGNIYYTLSEAENAPLQKMGSDMVLIIKKSDGTTWGPGQNLTSSTTQGNIGNRINSGTHPTVTFTASPESQSSGMTENLRVKRPPVTYNSVSEIETDKKGNRHVLVGDGDGQVLNMRIISDEEKTLSVTKNKEKFDRESLIIPDHVIIGNEVYTVTEIDKDAFFHNIGNRKIKEISFPETLKIIGEGAFSCIWNLKRIDLPESLNEIGKEAFNCCGGSDFEYIYIPKSVSKIGERCFRGVSAETSPWNYTQAKIMSLPDFINENNSEYYGIDDSAVEDYNVRTR